MSEEYNKKNNNYVQLEPQEIDGTKEDLIKIWYYNCLDLLTTHDWTWDVKQQLRTTVNLQEKIKEKYGKMYWLVEMMMVALQRKYEKEHPEIGSYPFPHLLSPYIG